MYTNTVETLATTGSLADPGYRIDQTLEGITLDYDYTGEDFAVIDTNINYAALPFQLGNGLVKKVLLTYNGTSKETKQILETLVMESADGPDANQAAGYNNSNEWIYSPANFKIDDSLLSMTDPTNYNNEPYAYGQGFTVVKQFLTAGANYQIGDPQYTAFYRAPNLTTFQAANVESNNVYVDGWYTSYVIACKTYALVDPANLGVAQGQIVFNELDTNGDPDEKFYVNLTGTATADTPDVDTVNWKVGPTLSEWKDFLSQNLDPVMPSNPVYFVESQHLATPELAQAIIYELEQTCMSCHTPKFDMTSMEPWMRLTQKRMGAWAKFNQELFHEAQCILETARKQCSLCLYHKKCLTKPTAKC